jgi:hypothetical protein
MLSMQFGLEIAQIMPFFIAINIKLDIYVFMHKRIVQLQNCYYVK